MSEQLDFTKPETLQTRDGRKVRIYATDGDGEFNIHGAIQCGARWKLCSWTFLGYRLSSGNGENENDIITKPLRVTGWVNVFGDCLGTTIFATKEEAKASADSVYGQIYIDQEVQP